MSRACIIIVAIALSSCVTARQQSDYAINRLDAALDAFVDARHEYPRTLQELSAFAAASGRPLDLTPLGKVWLERPQRSRVSIHIQTRAGSNQYVTLSRVST